MTGQSTPGARGSVLHDVPVVSVAGLSLASDPHALAKAAVADYVSRRRLVVIFAAHVTALNVASDPEFRAVFNSADGAHADGISWTLLAKAGAQEVKKAATSDLVPRALEQLSALLGRRVRVAVVGGDPGLDNEGRTVAGRAARALADQSPVDPVFVTHGFHSDWSGPLRQLDAAIPDAVLVGMGMPVEAGWVVAHRHELPESLVFTCGGWLRILAGDERRAPNVARRAQLEWAYRLVTDPSRTVERYTTGIRRLAVLSLSEWRAHRSGRRTQ